jgi:hypothetical protein
MEENNSLYAFLLISFENHARILNDVIKKLSLHLTTDQIIQLEKFVCSHQKMNIFKARAYKDFEEKDLSKSIQKIANGFCNFEFLDGNVKFYVKLEQFEIPDEIIREALGY